MKKKDKIAWMKEAGFTIQVTDRRKIRAQKNGYIANGTVNQVYEDIRHGGARV